ncbi:phage tail tip fiber protein, partial [Citrobacter freundii]
CNWGVDSDDLFIALFRVTGTRDNNDGTFEVTGTTYNPDIYSAVDTGARLDERPVSVIPPGVQAPPGNIVVDSYSTVNQNIAITTMRVAWDSVQGAVAYEAEWRRDSGNWISVPRTSSLGFEVQGIYSGRYLVRVRAVNASDVSSVWATSSEVNLTGKVGNPPKPVGFATTPINWGIRLNWGFPANTGDTLKTEIQYTANSDFSNPLLLSDVPYPSAEYTQLGLKAGQEFWYRAQLVDRTGNESGWTGWVRGVSNANADDYLGDIADDFLTSADGDRLTSDIDTNLEAALQNALANHGTVEHQFAQYGEVRADILVVKTTIADVNQAMAEMSTQVQAQGTMLTSVDGKVSTVDGRVSAVDGKVDILGQTTSQQYSQVTAVLQDKLTAMVDSTGASAIHTLKVGLRINGQEYNAGMSIAALAQPGQPVVTRIGFNANQFVLMSGSGDTQYSPFAVINGQVFISDAFIQDGSIDNAKIGQYIQSNVYTPGSVGWHINKNGNSEFNNVTV